MTNWQEAKLAREAEICFATLALASDYDCWNTNARAVTVEEILQTLHANVELARRAVVEIAAHLPSRERCACGQALANAIVTDPQQISAQTRANLSLLIEKYVHAAH